MCECRYVSLIDSFPRFTRSRHKDATVALKALRDALGDDLTANLIGVKRATLDFERLPIPVVRAAIMLHLIVFANGSKVKLFDVLTSGRYANRKIGVSGRPQSDVTPGDPPAP